MKNNNKEKLEFEGLSLDEALSGHMVKTGHNLIFEVAPKAVINQMIVESAVYEKRNDGLFSLEIFFPGTAPATRRPPSLTDLVVAIFEHDDAPYWLLDAISDGINDNASINAFDPDIIRAQMAFTTPKKKEKK